VCLETGSIDLYRRLIRFCLLVSKPRLAPYIPRLLYALANRGLSFYRLFKTSIASSLPPELAVAGALITVREGIVRRSSIRLSDNARRLSYYPAPSAHSQGSLCTMPVRCQRTAYTRKTNRVPASDAEPLCG